LTGVGLEIISQKSQTQKPDKYLEAFMGVSKMIEAKYILTLEPKK
jgi:hypothetical protein